MKTHEPLLDIIDFLFQFPQDEARVDFLIRALQADTSPQSKQCSHNEQISFVKLTSIWKHQESL